MTAMLALKDHQLANLMTAASKLPVEKRGVFLERVVARLSLQGFRFTDDELDDAVRRALVGLVHHDTAA
jgi:hypothetical protein